ncbi:hypothetical protein [Terricaulis sp.]|uniref:hypothetical protein n=1 Tax=Terricaulis sp. TaxID=2768686 RepID=UPI00378454F7
MRRIFVAAAVLAMALGASGPAAADDDAYNQAGDRLTEGLFQVTYDNVVEGQTIRGGTNSPFMVANPGNVVAFIAGCEQRCTRMQITLRAAGLPPLRSESTTQWQGLLILQVPQSYQRALSNYEIDYDIGCPRSDGCTMRWVAVSRGAAPSLEQRGLPRRITEAEWNAATPPVAGASLQWTTLPTSEDLRFFYPVQQWRNGAEGSARLQCLLVDGGRLRCRAATGASPGFADAALKLSPILRVSETDSTGASIRGRQIVVPIRFQPGS